MKYGGLVLDIDNFKFSNENELIDKLKVLKVLIKRNIPVVLYTDGNFQFVQGVIKNLDIKEPAIIMEGAKVYSPFQCEYGFDFHLSINTVEQLCLWAKKKNINFEVITNKGKIDYGEWLVKVKSFLLDCETSDCPRALEIVMNIPNESIHSELLKFISENYLECYSHFYKDKVVLINLRVDKGVTLRCLSKKKKWNLKNFVAIGSYPKDVSLFEEVGLGISVDTEGGETAKNIAKSDKINVLSECINNYF